METLEIIEREIIQDHQRMINALYNAEGEIKDIRIAMDVRIKNRWALSPLALAVAVKAVKNLNETLGRMRMAEKIHKEIQAEG